jgi:Uma2 family endonuclease
MLQHRLPSAIQHVREPRPIHFPEFELVAAGKRHLTLRTFLYQLLKHLLGPEHTVGSDQFVYWNAREPRRKLAPDVFLCRGIADSSFGSWKVWERRTPELAIEIVSPNEDEDEDWDDKLERYHELGVQELVRFDPDARAGERLRVWDRIDEDLLERRVENDACACVALGLVWVVCPVESEPVGLRLADADGRLVPNAIEAERVAREAAEARVRELEAELGARRG